jgi:hypothetical protein
MKTCRSVRAVCTAYCITVSSQHAHTNTYGCFKHHAIFGGCVQVQQPMCVHLLHLPHNACLHLPYLHAMPMAHVSHLARQHKCRTEKKIWCMAIIIRKGQALHAHSPLRAVQACCQLQQRSGNGSGEVWQVPCWSYAGGSVLAEK